jgi:hypothetical protein
MYNIMFHFYITPIKWNDYQALRYDQGRKNWPNPLNPYFIQGGKNTRRKANKKRKHSNTRRRIRRR